MDGPKKNKRKACCDLCDLQRSVLRSGACKEGPEVGRREEVKWRESELLRRAASHCPRLRCGLSLTNEDRRSYGCGIERVRKELASVTCCPLSVNTGIESPVRRGSLNSQISPAESSLPQQRFSILSACGLLHSHLHTQPNPERARLLLAFYAWCLATFRVVSDWLRIHMGSYEVFVVTPRAANLDSEHKSHPCSFLLDSCYPLTVLSLLFLFLPLPPSLPPSAVCNSCWVSHIWEVYLLALYLHH